MEHGHAAIAVQSPAERRTFVTACLAAIRLEQWEQALADCEYFRVCYPSDGVVGLLESAALLGAGRDAEARDSYRTYLAERDAPPTGMWSLHLAGLLEELSQRFGPGPVVAPDTTTAPSGQ